MKYNYIKLRVKEITSGFERESGMANEFLLFLAGHRPLPTIKHYWV